jgi:Na+/melibiose symporter-like transporter
MTKSEITSQYNAVTKGTGNRTFLVLLATLVTILVIPLALWHFGASEHTAGVVGLVLWIVVLPQSLAYVVWFSRRELMRSGLCCSSCQTPFDRRTMRTGKCWKCGQTVFDMGEPDPPRILASISYKTLLWIFAVVAVVVFVIVRLK